MKTLVQLLLVAVLLLSQLPLITQKAQAQQVTFTPICAGGNDTAAFQTIINGAAGNQRTINIPNKRDLTKRCALNTLTIPSNITLDNTDGSGIWVITGQTLTVQGPVVNPSGKQLFYNALEGQGTVSFSSNRSIAEYYPQWWGAVGDDTADDTDELQAMVDALPAKGTVRWTRGFEARTTAPLRIWTKRELNFISTSGTYYPDTATGIDYRGPNGTEAVQIYNSFGILWDGIKLKVNYDANVAQTGIDIDGFPNGTVIGGRTIAGQVTSNNTVRNINIITSNAGPDFTGIRLAYTSGSNCEMMRFENVTVIANGTDALNATNANRGTAFKIGGNGGGGNVLNTVYERCTWVYTSYGIDAVSGQVSASNCESQEATIDFRLTGSRPHILVNNRSENGRQFFTGRGDITMIGNQIAFGGWDAAYPLIEMTGPGHLTLINNAFDNDPTITSVSSDPYDTHLVMTGNSNLNSGTFANFNSAIRMGDSQSAPLIMYSGNRGAPGISAGSIRLSADPNFGGVAIKFRNASDTEVGSVGNMGVGVAFTDIFKVCYNAAATVCDFSGANSPEGLITASPGSTYRRTGGGAGTGFYVKESGTGNAGWIAK